MPEGRIPTSMIAEGLGPLFGSAWPAEPLWINAVRLGDGRRVAFGRDADQARGPGSVKPSPPRARSPDSSSRS